MKLGIDRHMPPAACCSCGRVMDGATQVGDEDSAPDPGDITVCIYCGHIQAYDDDLRLRELTPEEQSFIAGDPRILAIQRARAAAEKKERQRR